MTISQALRRIKKLKGKMAELTARGASCVSYAKGEEPKFDFIVTRAEINTVREELVTLEAAVARANATRTIDLDGTTMTIAEAVRRLQELKAEMAWLASLSLRDDTQRVPEHVWDEEKGRQVTKYRDVVHVTALTEQARVVELDALRDRFERCNDAVESANHTTPVELPTAT